jgi:hypothetical protein
VEKKSVIDLGFSYFVTHTHTHTHITYTTRYAHTLGYKDKNLLAEKQTDVKSPRSDGSRVFKPCGAGKDAE